MIDAGALVVLVAIALLLGVATGLVLAHQPEAPKPIEEAPAAEPERAGLAVLRAGLLDEARQAAWTLLPDAPDEQREIAAKTLAWFGAEQWGRGVSDMADAICEGTGLDGSVAETVSLQAVRRAERQRGIGA